MRHEEIKAVYRSLDKEATLYDEMITCSTLPGKLIYGLVWKMSKPRDDYYLDLTFSGIPEGFSGGMLETPVRTDILTMSVCRTLPKADITHLDYSTVMVETAQRRATAAGLPNVHFTQGDAGSLPFSDNTSGLMLSPNDLRAFPLKETAYRKTSRVLESDGIFCGCFYIRGKQSRTDWSIERLYASKGLSTPPFGTITSLENRMKQRYTGVTVTTIDSMECFCYVKGSEDTITHKS